MSFKTSKIQTIWEKLETKEAVPTRGVFLVLAKIVSSFDGTIVLLYEHSPPRHEVQSTPGPTGIIDHSNLTSQKFLFSQYAGFDLSLVIALSRPSQKTGGQTRNVAPAETLHRKRKKKEKTPPLKSTQPHRSF